MTARHRIYFDANSRDGDCFDLSVKGSLDDIKPIAADLRAGMRVTLYQPGELEVEAILEFDHERRTWIGRAVKGTWSDKVEN